MERTCDRCSNPAVVHETLVHNGVKTEVHLCAEHAAEDGYLIPSPGGPTILVGGLLEKAARAGVQRVKACPNCGMTMSSLRESGLVGCAACYRAFEEELGPIIERSQDGASEHVGRHPQHAAQLIDRAAMRNRLAKELREAVGREEYERAARIRDEMLSLGHDGDRDNDAGSESAGAPESEGAR